MGDWRSFLEQLAGIRASLDVCFFHPFADGNARVARLALDHVLTGGGLTLRSADPVFLMPWFADDDVVGQLAHLLILVPDRSRDQGCGPVAHSPCTIDAAP